MKIRELLTKVREAYDKSPDADVAIWIWEDYGKSPNNFDNCSAEKADITGIFGEVFIISCDKKGSKKKRYGSR